MEKPVLSIIIPTLNEEKHLPVLLDSIEMQDFPKKNLEVIVAISPKTTDNTEGVAKSYGCETVVGGVLPRARNNGAKIARAKLLMFTDADIALPNPHFLSDAVYEFGKENLQVAGTLQTPILTHKTIADLSYRAFFGIANSGMLLFRHSKKPFMQMCMFATKELHDRIGGFDETLEFGEDSEYAGRAAQSGGKFDIICRNTYVLASPRRLAKEGIWGFWKYLKFNAIRLAGYEVRIGGKNKFY